MHPRGCLSVRLLPAPSVEGNQRAGLQSPVSGLRPFGDCSPVAVRSTSGMDKLRLSRTSYEGDMSVFSYKYYTFAKEYNLQNDD